MNFNVNMKIHNYFEVEEFNPSTNEKKIVAHAENTLLNNLWSRLCCNLLSGCWSSYIHYGIGTGTPAITDSQLFSYKGAIATTIESTNYNESTKVFSTTKKIVIDTAYSPSINISELGFATKSDSGYLNTHAMLVDAEGNPTTVEKNYTNILTIYATIYVNMTLPTGVYFTGITEGRYNGYSYDFRIQSAMNLICGNQDMYSRNSYNYPLKINPTYGYAQSSIHSNATINYGYSNKYIQFVMPQMAAGSYNNRGFKLMYLGPWQCPEFIFNVGEGDWYTPARITGEQVGTGDGTTIDFSTKFDFAKNATVYVNGSEVPATVDYSIQSNSIVPYLRFIKCKNAAHAFNSNSDYCAGYIYSDGTNHYYNGSSFYDNDINSLPVFENTLYATVGISLIELNGISKVAVSNDLTSWVSISNNYNSCTIPSEYQNYRYWRFASTSNYSNINYCGGQPITITTNANIPSTTNIHLETAPATEDVITIDYDTDTIAKDANHTFDFSVTFRLDS